MARIRSIKPTFWRDQKIGKMKRDIRLMYIGLWNLADDEGVINADASLIKSELFPYDDDLRVNTVQDWIDHLIEARRIVPFEFNGEGYYIIRTFKDHQNINRPQGSKIPKEIIQKFLFSERSVNDHPPITGVGEGKGKDSIGKEGSGKPRARDEILKELLLTLKHDSKTYYPVPIKKWEEQTEALRVQCNQKAAGLNDDQVKVLQAEFEKKEIGLWRKLVLPHMKADATAMYDYYEKNDFKLSRGAPLTNWPATMRSWMNRKDQFKKQLT